MKSAIEARDGISGVSTAVVAIQEKRDEPKTKLANEKISLLNNFEFSEAGIRIWRAYNIGPGRVISLTHATPSIGKLVNVAIPRNTPEFAKIKPRKDPSKQAHSKQQDTDEDLFCCPEDACVKSYSTLNQLEAHLKTGKHKFVVENETLMDKACTMYATKLAIRDDTIPHRKPESIATAEHGPTLPIGWALKVVKKSSRFTTDQVNYLREKFQTGEETGKKLDAKDVAKDMRTVRNADGKKMFTVQEYLTYQQVNSFFSREAARRRAKCTSEATEATDGDIYAAEEEIHIDSLQTIVTTTLSLQHPLMFGDTDICHLAKEGTLSNLSLRQLKDICQSHQIDTTDVKTKRRKAPYVEKITTFSKYCPCFK